MLVDGGDPDGVGLRRGLECDRLASPGDGPARGRNGPGQDLDQSRLPRAIGAEEAMHLAREGVEVDAPQRDRSIRERSSRPPAGAAVASPRPAPSVAGSNRLPLADALIDIGLGDAWREIGDELVLAHLLARRRFVDGLEGELAQFFRLVADRAVDRAVLDRRDRQLASRRSRSASPWSRRPSPRARSRRPCRRPD